MPEAPTRKEANKLRDHMMVCRICENEDMVLNDLGRMYGISGNTAGEAIKRKMVNLGVRMENGDKPRSIKQVRSCYSEYLSLKGIDETPSRFHA